MYTVDIIPDAFNDYEYWAEQFRCTAMLLFDSPNFVCALFIKTFFSFQYPYRRY